MIDAPVPNQPIPSAFVGSAVADLCGAQDLRALTEQARRLRRILDRYSMQHDVRRYATRHLYHANREIVTRRRQQQRRAQT